MLEAILMVVVGLTAALFFHVVFINLAADRVAASICLCEMPLEEAKSSIKWMYRLFYALLVIMWLIVMKITWLLLS